MVKAWTKGNYVFVGSKPRHSRSFTGLEKAWKRTDKPSEMAIVAIPSLKLMGSPQDIQAALAYLNLAPNQIDYYMATAFTAQNYNVGAAAAYKEELAQAKAIKAEVKSHLPTMDQGLYFARLLGQVGGSLSDKQGVKSVKVPASRRRGTTLAQKYTDAKADPSGHTAVDVSGLKDDGTGGIKRHGIAPGSKGGKVKLDGFPLISNDVSKFELAFRYIFGDQASGLFVQYQVAFQQAAAQLAYNRQRMAAPAAAGLQPFSAQVAPAVSFAPPSGFGPGYTPASPIPPPFTAPSGFSGVAQPQPQPGPGLSTFNPPL